MDDNKKGQCIAALISVGISEESAKNINNVSDDAADCIYKYALTSAYFACDEIIEICIDVLQHQQDYPAKNILYIIHSLANSRMPYDELAQFISEHINDRFEDLRREAYALIRIRARTGILPDMQITEEQIQNIVSDVFVNIMNAISALDGKVQDISDNIDKENDDGYSDLIVQISNLQEKIDEKEAQIQELTDEIAVFKEKEEISGNSLSHDSLVKIAKIAKRKKRSISADLVKACRTGRMSAEDAVFFLENTTAEEFDEIVKLYLE